MAKFKDLSGQRFGKLQPVNEKLAASLTKGSHTKIKVQCDCGNVTEVMYKDLTSGNTKSCGCLNLLVTKRLKELNITHGMTKTRFYRIWAGTKSRCSNPKDDRYYRYGACGTRVCDRWLDFLNFKEDMYESYLKHVEEFGEANTSIDRIDVNGNYEPSNCRWATKKEQQRNLKRSSKSEDYDGHLFWISKLRKALSHAVSYEYKNSLFLEKYLGCSLNNFRIYIESLWLLGMDWDNYGKGSGKWQLDHIIGCNNFDLSKEQDRLVCFNYTNLQPLWYEDHKNKAVFRKEYMEVVQ
jgi:hypothetical protein